MTEYIYDTSRVETQPEQGFTGEEIIRFRDCRYYEYGICAQSTCSYCAERHRVEPDGFCAWGERRDE